MDLVGFLSSLTVLAVNLLHFRDAEYINFCVPKYVFAKRYEVFCIYKFIKENHDLPQPYHVTSSDVSQSDYTIH